MKNRTKFGLVGLCLVGVIGFSGCASLTYKHPIGGPVFRAIYDSMPRFLQPGGYRDYKEEEKEQKREKSFPVITLKPTEEERNIERKAREKTLKEAD